MNNFSDILRFFFGLNRQDPGGDQPGSRNDFRNPIWNIDDDDDTDDELHHHFGNGHGNNMPGGESFHIFSNPLEIHRYFEQQMEEMMKSFGSMMGAFEGMHPPSLQEIPSSSSPAYKEKGKGTIRDEYLKPGYQHSLKASDNMKTDTDLDGKITADDLNSLFKKKDDGMLQPRDNPSSQLEGFSWQPSQRPSFFGHSIITRSVTRPDGTVETTRTVRDSNGESETTVTVSEPGNYGVGSSAGRDRGDITSFNNIWKGFFGF